MALVLEADQLTFEDELSDALSRFISSLVGGLCCRCDEFIGLFIATLYLEKLDYRSTPS